MFSWRTLCRAVSVPGFVVVSGMAVGQHPLSQNAAKIERHVAQLAPDAKVSVIPYRGEEEFGTFVSKTAEGFTFHDVDTKIDVTTKYEEVKDLRDGYGGYNHIRHRHTDRRRSMIIGAVVIAGLLGLVFAVALAS